MWTSAFVNYGAPNSLGRLAHSISQGWGKPGIPPAAREGPQETVQT